MGDTWCRPQHPGCCSSTHKHLAAPQNQGGFTSEILPPRAGVGAASPRCWGARFTCAPPEEAVFPVMTWVNHGVIKSRELFYGFIFIICRVRLRNRAAFLYQHPMGFTHGRRGLAGPAPPEPPRPP